MLSTCREGTPSVRPQSPICFFAQVKLFAMCAAVDRSLTLIAFLPDGLHKRRSRVDLLADLLQSLNPTDVSCVQFMPDGYVRVTFTSLVARGNALVKGIFLGPNRLRVFEAQKLVRTVFVHRLPFEVSDDDVRSAFEEFGPVHEITPQKFPGSPIFTGSRILKMSLTTAIPVEFRVLRYPCRVFYHSQPRSCSICKVPDHRAPDCPLRDVCRSCRQPGHFARKCRQNVENVEPVPPAESVPPAEPVVPVEPVPVVEPSVKPFPLLPPVESKPVVSSPVIPRFGLPTVPVPSTESVTVPPRRPRIKPVPNLSARRPPNYVLWSNRPM